MVCVERSFILLVPAVNLTASHNMMACVLCGVMRCTKMLLLQRGSAAACNLVVGVF
jgi:hypothetical protein